MTAPTQKKRQINKPLLIVFVTMFVLTGVNILYTNQTVHKFCALMVTLDDAYNQGPTQPATSIGKRVANNIHDLRNNLGCKEK